MKGKKALLTGASSGIGRALGLVLAAEGVELALAARRGDALEALADEISAAGGARPVVLPADLSRRGNATRLAERALDALGSIDLLVNNAGVSLHARQEALGDDDEARALFETNYWSPLALVRALVPAMRARDHGLVINVESLGALLPFPLGGFYVSSKAALALASETMRLELHGTGVHVLSVQPGPVETPMIDAFRTNVGAEMLANVPIGDTATLARRIVQAIARKKNVLVYPGAFDVARHWPTLARSAGNWLLRRRGIGNHV